MEDMKQTETTEQVETTTQEVVETTSTEEAKPADVKPNLINLDSLTTADLDKLFSENEVFKQHIEKAKDSHFSKSLKTWKQNNLAAEVEKELAKRFPAETPEQKRIRELEQAVANERRERILEKAEAKALKVLAEKGLPVELAQLVVTEDESKMLDAINALTKTFDAAVQARVEKTFKENGRTPGRAGQELSPYNVARKSGNIKDMIKAKAKLN